MYDKTAFKYLVCLWGIFAIWVVGCTSQLPIKDFGTVTPALLPQNTVIIAHSTSAPPALTITKPVSSTVTATPEATQVLNSTITPQSTISPSPQIVQQKGCPILDRGNSPSLLSSGSILISQGIIWEESRPYDLDQEPGVLAVAASNLEPHLIYESTSGGFISPDGTTLLYIMRDIESLIQEVVFYNMVSKQEIRLTVPYEFGFRRWLPNGRIQFEHIIEQTLGIGETREILLLDPTTQKDEIMTVELNLPDYSFNTSEMERFGLFYGYHSLSPDGRLILYSAQQSNKNDFEIRLLDLDTGEIIWHQVSNFLSSSSPKWATDGNRILFDVNLQTTDTNSSWNNFISLTREGQVEELPLQPFPLLNEGRLSYYSLSLDEQYIFYIAVETNTQDFSIKNRAFIVNVSTGEVGEICDPVAEFIAFAPPHNNAEGHWLPNGQFIYRVLLEENGQLTHSLRILDISTWTTQILFDPEPGYGVNIIGWTPVEFP